jgi:hypothetical protein
MGIGEYRKAHSNSSLSDMLRTIISLFYNRRDRGSIK